MKWHVVVKYGALDAFQPPIPVGDGRIWAAFDNPTDPSSVKNDVVRKMHSVAGLDLSEFTLDLVQMAMSCYTADLRIPRRFSADGWSRDITMYLPVYDVARWTPAVASLVKMLCFLTGDSWTIELRSRAARKPGPAKQQKLGRVAEVCLFSGGLDSLVGAIDRLHAGGSVALVGHHGAGITNPVQDRVLAPLLKRYGVRATPFMFWVQPPRLETDDTETTMRSRSILFLALGLAVANSFGPDIPLVVAENGLISLNVPLTGSRSGSLSTRTTHPHLFILLREVLGHLGIRTPLVLPYRFKTKGEMLLECTDPDALRDSAALTMSCSHPESGRFRGGTPGHHCGYCVPCIIRRASIRAAGLPDAHYNIDVLKKAPESTTESGRDLRAFEIALERLRDAEKRRYLVDVLGTGPLPPEDVAQYASVYQRGMEEVGALLGDRTTRTKRSRTARVS